MNLRSALDEVIEWRAPKLPPRVYTRPTRSALTLLNYYETLAAETGGFRRSLTTITEETGLTRASVRRGNECLRQLGWLIWDRGYGFNPARRFTNAYTLNVAAIRAHKARP